MKQKILITGSSGSLGKELVSEFIDDQRYNVFRHSTKKSSGVDLIADFRDEYLFGKTRDFIFDNDITSIINCAGIYYGVDFIHMTDKEIQDVLKVNTLAPILLSKYLHQYLYKSKTQGLIININSLAGKYPNYKESIYCASKHALTSFSSSLSMNQKNSKIKTIDCHIGAMKSDMTINRENYKDLLSPKEVARFIKNIVDNSDEYVVSSFELRNTK